MAKSITSAIEDIKVSSDLPNLFLSGLTKYGIEKFSSPYIGNSTFMSGGIKLIAGVGVDMFLGKNNISKILKQALIIDGVEDVTTQLLSGVFNKGNVADNSINIM